MATATLVLDQPQLVTLEGTATNLREVVLPKGARYLEYSSDSAWYYEVDDGVLADGGAGTAAEQQRIGSGTGSIRAPGSSGGRARVKTPTSIFLAGSSSSQQVWLTATSRSP